MSDAGIFVMVDRAGLQADVQLRITSGDYYTIPVWDEPSREAIARVHQLWFQCQAARDDLYGAVFARSFVGESMVVFTAAKRYMLGGRHELPGLFRRYGDILLPRGTTLGHAALTWLQDNFAFPPLDRRGF